VRVEGGKTVSPSEDRRAHRAHFRTSSWNPGQKVQHRVQEGVRSSSRTGSKSTSTSPVRKMTAGGLLLKNFSWPLKTKKRQRSGSGGSWDLKDHKRKSLSSTQQKKLGGRKGSGGEGESAGSSLEIVAPATSDVEFKYSWPIHSFVHQVKSCKSDGLDSRPFDINVNGVLTTWTLSVRFWVGENGERLSNPFVLCLNLVNCKVEGNQDVRVKYKFGILNRQTEEPEMGPPERVSLKLERVEKLQSIGYKNIAMNDKHVNAAGDVLLYVRMCIIREEEAAHSLSSDLGSLINDEKSSDLILQAGERRFMVHQNILAARSPVFADLLARMEADIQVNPVQPASSLQNIPDLPAIPDLSVSGGPRRQASSSDTCLQISPVESDTPSTSGLIPQPVAGALLQSDIQIMLGRERLEAELLDDTSKLSNILEDAVEDEEEEDAHKHKIHSAPAAIHAESALEESTNNSIDLVINTEEEEPEAKSPLASPKAESRKNSPIIKSADCIKENSAALEDECGKSVWSSVAAEGRRKLVIDDLPGDTAEQLLKYIYTDSSHNVELFSQTLLAASDRYKLPGLKQHCEKHLFEIMNPVNVADILLLSENYSCSQLKRSALTYCGENHSYIMKDSKWKTIEEENPDLFAEAIALVAPETCSQHVECLKKGGNRYDAEKNSKSSSVGARKKSNTRKL